MFQKNFVLLDTEYTATAESKSRNWRGEHKEVIHIGAIKVRADDLQPLSEFEVFVRPKVQPVLSVFIMELTGIRQRDVDNGVSLQKALEEIAVLFPQEPIYSWGRDGDVIIANCELLKITCPIAQERFVDIHPTLAPILEKMGIDPQKYSSGNLLEAFGRTGKRAHNALHDMQNFLEVLQILRMRGFI